MKAVTDFLFVGSKITLDGECSHKIRRQLLLGRKAMRKPRQCIKKQRYHFADKGPYSQGYVFPVVKCACESWIIKKEECQRIDAFELCCWRRVESPLDSKEIKPVNLREINPEYSL